ncbi:MAG: M48 family metallopeptidase [Candidatus Nomurabacteria bacterium]|nr:M48 family metallopeptidase [Candidatus Nomurabacteria bacterium]USN88289.1 MAG: M48 family metallopeptidase [Candidatus Nomurabacteria bacterium]
MKSSPKQQKEFIFGSFVYCYDLIKQDRKTLSLTVTPDMRICVKCPHEADDERIEQFLKKKWFWLQKQLNFFGKYQRKTYTKEYVSGESFHYLGRQHKLIVRKGEIDSVSLLRGVLMVSTTKALSDGVHTQKLVKLWFDQKRQSVFEERFNEMLERFDYKHTPALTTRDMKRRWGSFVNKDKIILNPKLIHVSKDCIDYVIVHELCHMRYKNHDKKFFAFLDEKYPKWEKKKDKLEAFGVHIL